METISESKKKTNRGTGAGGSNTNANGLKFETCTELNSEYSSSEKLPVGLRITFRNHSKKLISLRKAEFKRYMQNINSLNKNLDDPHGCKQPDECFINPDEKTITIIEKKNQTRSGSVCEKIQTGVMKRWHFQKKYSDYKINYVYTLSDWFKDNCKSELEYLKHENIPVFWGDDINYKSKMVEFITNN